MSYTALYRKFRLDEFEDVKDRMRSSGRLRTRSMQTVSDMHICSAGQEEPVRRRLQKYLRKQSTANIR